MKLHSLDFERPDSLQATEPVESRGKERDEVRLLVTTPDGNTHATFRDIYKFLEPGDLLVVNESATIPASLPAVNSNGRFIINLSTNYGHNLWLAEPRLSTSQPESVDIEPGEVVDLAGMKARLIGQYPGIPRLWFTQVEGDLEGAISKLGSPIRYGYVDEEYPLDTYQTHFGRIPGSAEMPSASRPFTKRVMDDLEACGVKVASLILHTGVSSLEVDEDDIEEHEMYPEPYSVPASTADAVNAALAEGRRVIAVGTTVVRALESAWDGEQVQPSSGFTRLYIHPGRGVNVVDGLITGFHDPKASHLAMLYAIAGEETVRSAYVEAVKNGYLWHEFGDSNLILTK